MLREQILFKRSSDVLIGLRKTPFLYRVCSENNINYENSYKILKKLKRLKLVNDHNVITDRGEKVCDSILRIKQILKNGKV